jgi:Ca-activated chloride channel homolog
VVALPHFFCANMVKLPNFRGLETKFPQLYLIHSAVTFAQPIWLSLFFVLFLIEWWQRHRSAATHQTAMQVSTRLSVPSTWRTHIAPIIPWLRLAWMPLLILAMARPQRQWQEEKVKADALDILLTMDISPSMLSKDFDPDRLAVAKKVATEFVEKRPYDRIGLVAFSAEAFTQCPLTNDRTVVKSFIQELSVGRLEDGTAIGMGLATAVNRLKDSPSRSKLVILLTDGENNAGTIGPMQAAGIAHALGIRVYTVGIGTEGIVMSPASRNMETNTYEFAPRMMQFDTELLRQMADSTGGKFYRAYSEKDLSEIYGEIDRLEKTRVEMNVITHKKDYFQALLGFAILILLVEMVLRWWWLRSTTLSGR